MTRLVATNAPVDRRGTRRFGREAPAGGDLKIENRREDVQIPLAARWRPRRVGTGAGRLDNVCGVGQSAPP